MKTTDADRQVVAELLGRQPQGAFEIVVRDEAGVPRVIRNAPFLDDGTPMPTRYWLVGPRDNLLMGRLESAGGVRRSEADLDLAQIQVAHDAYCAERDSVIPVDYTGPRPSAGVGGTRKGVKCLHAHYAHFLAGGEDPVGEWIVAHLHEVDETIIAPSTKVVAAIDCGTNSTRLLISRGGTETLERRTKVTRLGHGVDATGRLDDAAIARVVDCLGEYKQLIDRHDVQSIRMTATSAARDAANTADFFDAAEAVLGVRPELLAGHEEGALAYAGATSDLDPHDGPYLLVDIGGGSTEFAVGGPEFVGAMTTDMGCVRMSEKYLHSDPPLPEELSAVINVVGVHIDDVLRELPQVTSARRFVAVAGTVASAAAIEQGLHLYDRDKVHHFVLTRTMVEEIFRTLATESAEDRAHNPGLSLSRVPTIVAGMAILAKIMRKLNVDECLVSETDILDGLVFSQL